MEPIVSPWLVYLIGVLPSLGLWACIVVFLIPAIPLVYFMVTEELLKSKLLYIGWVVCFILAVLIPSRETLIGMIVAKQITPQNISTAIKTGKDLKDEMKKDVIEIINAITKEKSTEKKKEK